jgi:hypothetical protein
VYSHNVLAFLLRFISFKAFAVVAVMIARVRPSLNGAREALKTWDEASVVWPRFEVWNFTSSDLRTSSIIYYQNRGF